MEFGEGFLEMTARDYDINIGIVRHYANMSNNFGELYEKLEGYLKSIMNG